MAEISDATAGRHPVWPDALVELYEEQYDGFVQLAFLLCGSGTVGTGSRSGIGPCHCCRALRQR